MVLVACEWPFADFLMSPASRNRFFGTGYFGYPAAPDGFARLHQFASPLHGSKLAARLVIACGVACVSAALGTLSGRWMREVRR